MIKNKRILHISNFDIGLYKPSVSYYSCDNKISIGFIKNNNIVKEFSYNDILRMNSLADSRKYFQKKGINVLYKTVESFQPEIIVLGHVNIPREVLKTIKEISNKTKIICWYVDPPEIKRMERYRSIQDLVDVMFATSGGETLKQIKEKLYKIPKMCFFPNPVDSSIEYLESFNNHEHRFDVLYCGSDSRYKNRTDFFQTTTQLTKNLNWFLAGLMNKPKVFGDQYYKAMSQTSFGINISKFYPNTFEFYSSDRIAQLIGNGLLTFNQKFPRITELLDFDSKTIFETPEELSRNLNYFKNNLSEAKEIARKNHDQYHQLYSSKIICEYFLDVLYENNLEKYHWSNEIY